MTEKTPAIASVAAVLLSWACAGGPPAPEAIEAGRDACSHCRMTVSDARLAAQIVAPGEEPRFFDDIGCLASYLQGARDVAPGTVAYVADHRTGAWVPAGEAAYTRAASLSTPMGSGLVAHATAASRDDDPEARAGERVAPGDIFGPSGPPVSLP